MWRKSNHLGLEMIEIPSAESAALRLSHRQQDRYVAEQGPHHRQLLDERLDCPRMSEEGRYAGRPCES